MTSKPTKKKTKAHTVTYSLGTAKIYLTIPDGFVPPPTITLYQTPNEYEYIYEG